MGRRRRQRPAQDGPVERDVVSDARRRKREKARSTIIVLSSTLAAWGASGWALHRFAQEPWWVALLALPWIALLVVATIFIGAARPLALFVTPVAWAVGAWCANEALGLNLVESVLAGPIVVLAIVVGMVLGD